LLNLESVVIGGGVSAAGAFLLERVKEHTRRRVFPQVFADCTFRLTELGPDAGVLGAARVAIVGHAPDHSDNQKLASVFDRFAVQVQRQCEARP